MQKYFEFWVSMAVTLPDHHRAALALGMLMRKLQRLEPRRTDDSSSQRHLDVQMGRTALRRLSDLVGTIATDSKNFRLLELPRPLRN